MITKKEALELLKKANLKKIAEEMLNEKSGNIALVVQENRLQVVQLIPGARLTDAFVVYILPVNWEDSLTQQELLDQLENAKEIIKKKKEIKQECIIKDIKIIIEKLKNEKKAKWEFSLNYDDELIIDKNGSFYLKKNVNEITNKLIDKHPLN